MKWRRKESVPLCQYHIHLSLSGKPTARHCPILVRLDQIYVEASIELDDDLSKLHHSEILADAISCPGSELCSLRQICYHNIDGREYYSEHIRPHSRHIPWITVDPSLGSELVRILAKNSFVSVDDPAIHSDNAVFWNVLPVQSNAAFGTAAFQDEPRAWVDPKGLIGNSNSRFTTSLSFRLQGHGW